MSTFFFSISQLNPATFALLWAALVDVNGNISANLLMSKKFD